MPWRPRASRASPVHSRHATHQRRVLLEFPLLRGRLAWNGLPPRSASPAGSTKGCPTSSLDGWRPQVLGRSPSLKVWLLALLASGAAGAYGRPALDAWLGCQASRPPCRKGRVVARPPPPACGDPGTAPIAGKTGKIDWRPKRRVSKLSFRNVLDHGDGIRTFLDRRILSPNACLASRPRLSEAEGCRFEW